MLGLISHNDSSPGILPTRQNQPPRTGGDLQPGTLQIEPRYFLVFARSKGIRPSFKEWKHWPEWRTPIDGSHGEPSSVRQTSCARSGLTCATTGCHSTCDRFPLIDRPPVILGGPSSQPNKRLIQSKIQSQSPATFGQKPKAPQASFARAARGTSASNADWSGKGCRVASLSDSVPDHHLTTSMC